MLIFDKFPDRDSALAFCRAIENEFKREWHIYDSQEEANARDPFPYKLTPPIVHIHRTLDKREVKIQAAVKRFKGRFAGT